MGAIRLLDCTLRDGGFINDWHFGEDNIKRIASGAVAAGTDIVELGFINARRPFDPARSIFPDTASINKIFEDISWGESAPVAMIDYGTCPLSKITPKSESLLAGIRVIFKKEMREQALDFCGELQARGYAVFAQPVSVTSYTERELYHLFSLLNMLNPTTVSIVDTYGLLQKDSLFYYFSLFDQALSPDIALGFHAHNNLQLAFSNCLSFLEIAKSRSCHRTLTLDGSMLGMGKSAGNAPLELLLAHLNNAEHANYRLKPLLFVIDSVIARLYGDAPWGYRLPFFLSAITCCHPQYVFYLTKELHLGMAEAFDILQRLHQDKRLTFDKSHLLTCLNEGEVKAPIFTGEKR